jgi:hypothetical protein
MVGINQHLYSKDSAPVDFFQTKTALKEKIRLDFEDIIKKIKSKLNAALLAAVEHYFMYLFERFTKCLVQETRKINLCVKKKSFFLFHVCPFI